MYLEALRSPGDDGSSLVLRLNVFEGKPNHTIGGGIRGL